MTEKAEAIPQFNARRWTTLLLVGGVLLWFMSGQIPHKQSKGQDIRLYTHNIRYDNKNLVQNERPWAERAPLIVKSINLHAGHGCKGHTKSVFSFGSCHATPTVVGLQEVLHNQLEDILAGLGPDWTYYGVGRLDGERRGEFAPILYQRLVFELVRSRTYWLSPTPEKPSRGWDAALERIATEVVLRHVASGKLVKVLNTHFDHKGVEARRELVKLIISKMEAGDEPAFLCGDFNTQPTDEPYLIMKDGGFQDLRTRHLNADETRPTFTGFNTEGETIIDYVWAEAGPKWKAYHVLNNRFGILMSDHRPVIADYTI